MEKKRETKSNASLRKKKKTNPKEEENRKRQIKKKRWMQEKRRVTFKKKEGNMREGSMEDGENSHKRGRVEVRSAGTIRKNVIMRKINKEKKRWEKTRMSN